MCTMVAGLESVCVCERERERERERVTERDETGREALAKYKI